MDRRAPFGTVGAVVGTVVGLALAPVAYSAVLAAAPSHLLATAAITVHHPPAARQVPSGQPAGAPAPVPAPSAPPALQAVRSQAANPPAQPPARRFRVTVTAPHPAPVAAVVHTPSSVPPAPRHVAPSPAAPAAPTTPAVPPAGPAQPVSGPVEASQPTEESVPVAGRHHRDRGPTPPPNAGNGSDD